MPYADAFFRGIEGQGTTQKIAYRVTIQTDAATADDDVYVTFDNDTPPRRRFLVQWRPRISDSGALTRVYPSKGKKGVIIPVDIGRPWLLW